MDATTATLVIGIVGVVGTLLAALGSQWLSNRAAKRARYEEKLAELLLLVADVDHWMIVELGEWQSVWYFGGKKNVVHRDTSCPIFRVRALSLYLNPKLYLHASNMVKHVIDMMDMPEIIFHQFTDTDIENNTAALDLVEGCYNSYKKEREQIHSYVVEISSNKQKRI